MSQKSRLILIMIGLLAQQLVRGLSAQDRKGKLKAPADALMGDLAKLEKSWSPMTGRNLMSDMLRSAKAIDQHLKQPGPGSQPELAGVSRELLRWLEGELGAHSPTKMRYQKVACFGYKVKLPGGAYQGKSDDGADLRARCREMIAAVRAAYSLADRDGRQLNADSSVLKVFLAPEFFFRGKNGAYDFTTLNGAEERTNEKGKVLDEHASGLLTQLLSELKLPIYKDWLFVPGTAVGAMAMMETRCTVKGCKGSIRRVADGTSPRTRPVCSADPGHKVVEEIGDAHVENVAYVIKEGAVHSVSKEIVSDLDFTGHRSGQDDRVDLLVGKKRRKLTVHRKNGPTTFTDERMGGCVFTIDGITFGLEVCLDHDASRVSGADELQGRLQHAGNIQIHLLPSWGMQFQRLRTVPGGISLNVDGATPHVAVVGGANPVVEINMSRALKLINASWSDLAPIGADVGKIQDLADAGTGKITWTAVPPAAPVLGGRGSVLLFGPYDIPVV